MQSNLPVTQFEYQFPETDLLVSTTDTRGHITHCNQAFVTASGYSQDELLGQPHNLVRHPDMPEAAFKDMWRTIGRGQPWTGLVKNRRKNGDHYWVEANVTPIMEGGKPTGYMSVRVQPSREQVAAATALYERLRRESTSPRPSVALDAGRVRRPGLRGWPSRLRTAPLTAYLAALSSAVIGLSMVPDLLHWDSSLAWLARLLVLSLGMAAALSWFHARISTGLNEAVRFAGELSACNLAGRARTDLPEPLGGLMRRLYQIQVNLRAVVGDARREITGFGIAAAEITQGSFDLSERTESQASSLEQTAASMEELASTVRQTADTAAQVCTKSDDSTAVAQRGAHAVRDAQQAMEAIQQSSRQIGDISDVIEGIAFQTNILSLNAAVEAARAGEQGRGFAVVAAEVRLLANRSSVAAKEIRQLIGQAQARTEEGAKRIDGAGATLEEVMQSVSQVSTLVRQISSATREQSLGISQVNEAVVQLDAVTQQNAALVEQSTSAAASLSQSAGSLQSAVSVFHMPGDASSAVAPRAPLVPQACSPRQNPASRSPQAQRQLAPSRLRPVPALRAVPARRPLLRAA